MGEVEEVGRLEVGGVSRPTAESGVESALFWVLRTRILGALLRRPNGSQRFARRWQQMEQDVYTVGPQVVSRREGASRVSVSLETGGRSAVKYTSVRLRRVQSTRGVRLRRWRPHSRKVPWKWSWPAIKPSLELPERGSALPSAFQSPPSTGPQSLNRRDDLPRFHTRRV